LEDGVAAGANPAECCGLDCWNRRKRNGEPLIRVESGAGYGVSVTLACAVRVAGRWRLASPGSHGIEAARNQVASTSVWLGERPQSELRAGAMTNR
jgi:hypothetical protein